MFAEYPNWSATIAQALWTRRVEMTTMMCSRDGQLCVEEDEKDFAHHS